MKHPEDRPLTNAELGLTVTIAIVALTFDGHVVAVSDRMISNGDVFQADDAATLKTIQVTDNWHAAFAGDPGAFRVVTRKLTAKLDGKSVNEFEVRKLAAESYEEALREDFASRNLIQLGYKSVDEFRQCGRDELGDNLFNKLTMELLQAQLGLDLIVFGLDPSKQFSARLFEVVNPGRVVERVLGYAAVGTGYHMAMAALRRKPLGGRDLNNTIYRLLDAKFSAETASGVGKATTVIWMRPDGEVRRIDTEEVDQVRVVWDELMKQPNPLDAVTIINRYTREP